MDQLNKNSVLSVLRGLLQI